MPANIAATVVPTMIGHSDQRCVAATRNAINSGANAATEREPLGPTI